MERDDKAILRAQVELELRNKKQCSYEPYQCSNLSVDDSKFCLKHILNDKNAGYKQCNYYYQNTGKRCQLPAPKGDRKDYGYCNEHALKATLSRNKQNAKNPPPLTAETLLTNLTHYVKKPRNKIASSSSYISDEERNHGDDNGESKVVRAADPFVDVDASGVYNEHCNEVLDMCSESESDVEPSTYATVWHDANADSSDNESIDSEDEDPLKHANVYTAEEISLLTRDKLVRLQSLYIEQYKHLRYLLTERRRKYMHSLKREKETCCNIYNQVRDNPKEQRLYRKLKQYNKYHRAYGEEAILEKRLHDLRAKISEGVPFKSSSYSRCLFTEGGVKCGERAIPMAKHCRKHILEDPNQVLFKACGKVNGDVECNTPVEAMFDDSTCKLHMDIPLIRPYSQPRKDSESEPDDTLDLHGHYAISTSDNVKTEMIDYSLPSLPKMETLPTLLFEDSAESLSSTLQYSTSEFTESFAEPNDESEQRITYPEEVEQTTASGIAAIKSIDSDITPKPEVETNSDLQTSMATDQPNLSFVDNSKADVESSPMEFVAEENKNEESSTLVHLDTEELNEEVVVTSEVTVAESSSTTENGMSEDAAPEHVMETSNEEVLNSSATNTTQSINLKHATEQNTELEISASVTQHFDNQSMENDDIKNTELKEIASVTHNIENQSVENDGVTSTELDEIATVTQNIENRSMENDGAKNTELEETASLTQDIESQFMESESSKNTDLEAAALVTENVENQSAENESTKEVISTDEKMEVE